MNVPHLNHLDKLVGPGTGEEEWTGSLEERIQQTKSWACWAQGLKAEIMKAVRMHLKMQPQLKPVRVDPVDMNGRSLVREEEEHPLPAEDDLLPEADEEMEPLEVGEDEDAVAEEKEKEKDVGDLEN